MQRSSALAVPGLQVRGTYEPAAAQNNVTNEQECARLVGLVIEHNASSRHIVHWLRLWHTFVPRPGTQFHLLAIYHGALFVVSPHVRQLVMSQPCASCRSTSHMI